MTYTIYSTNDGLGGRFENGPIAVADGLSRSEAASHVAFNHEHHADCAPANERLIWDGDGVTCEPIEF